MEKRRKGGRRDKEKGKGRSRMENRGMDGKGKFIVFWNVVGIANKRDDFLEESKERGGNHDE